MGGPVLVLLGLVIVGLVAYVLGRRVARSRLDGQGGTLEGGDARAVARDLGLPS